MHGLQANLPIYTNWEKKKKSFVPKFSLRFFFEKLYSKHNSNHHFKSAQIKDFLKQMFY